jgi:hypothetical protein
MAGAYDPFADKESFEHYEALLRALRQRRGIAVLGAGASYPLPGWSKLYQQVRGAAKNAGVQLLSGGYPLTQLFSTAKLQEPRSGWLLEQIRESLPSSGPLPELYELTRMSRHFNAVHTFNYDDHLHRSAANEGSSAESYPFDSWTRESFRFMYLHGSLSYARNISDLVLCEEDYQDAYNSGSVLVDVLNLHYKQSPVLFIGCSLSDDYFKEALHRIATSIAFLTREGQREFISRPQWFILLKNPKSPQEKVHVQNMMSRNHVRTIWYSGDDDTHESLYESLNALKASLDTSMAGLNDAPGTVLTARAAVRAAAIARPNATQIQMGLYLLENKQAREAFFTHARSPDWFEPLRSKGLLDPDEPTVSADGSSATAWHASDYLARVAPSIPHAVVSYISTLRTSNWIATRQAARVLATLSEADFWRLAPKVAEWLRASTYNDDLIREAARRVIAAERPQRWDAVLTATALRLSNDRGGYSEVLTVGAIGTSAFVSAAAADPKAGRILASTLDSYAARTWSLPADDASWIERRAIAEDETNPRNPGLAWLCLTSIAVLRGLRGSDHAAKTVRYFLESRWPLTRRIALYELSFNADLREEVEARIRVVLRRNFSSSQVYHELTLLAEAIAQSTRPSDLRLFNDLKIWMERLSSRKSGRAARWRRILSGEASEEDRFLFGPVEVFTPAAPLRASEIAERFGTRNGAGLVAMAAKPESFGVEIGWRQDAELLWESLAEYVRQTNRLDVVLALDGSILAQHEYATAVIRALPDLSLTSRDVRRVERWMARLVESGQSHATGAALDAAMRLADRSNAGRMLTSLSLSVVRASGVPIDHELPMGTSWEDGKPPDIMMRQLNDASGKAAQVLVESFFAERRAKGEKAAPPAWAWAFGLEPEWDFVECRVAIGQVVPFLVVADPERAKAVIARVFGPYCPLLAREAFWGGYCWRAQPHRQTLEMLSTEMCVDVARSSEFDHSRREVKEQLASHAAIGWIQGLAGFGPLTDLTFSRGDAEAIERLIRAAGSILNGADQELLTSSLPLLGDLIQRSAETTAEVQRGFVSWLWSFRGKALDEQAQSWFRHLIEALPSDEVYAILEFIKALLPDQANSAAVQMTSLVVHHLDAPQLKWHSSELYPLLLHLRENMSWLGSIELVVRGLLNAGILTPEQSAVLLNLA